MNAKLMAVGCIAALVIATASQVNARPHEPGEDHHADASAAPAQTKASGDATASPKSFGTPGPARDSMPLAQALAETENAAQQRAISGRIGKVCQNKGCWMTLHDGDALVRVETGHRFAIPADASGDAVVYGALKRKTLDEEGAAHLRSESLAVVAGDAWVIDAVGVRVLE